MPSPRIAHPAVPLFNRNLVIAGGVVVFLVAALWGLQSGLLRRALEVVVPVALLSDVITPPTPVAQLPAAPARPPEPVQEPVVKKPVRPPPPAPAPAPVPAANPLPVTTPDAAAVPPAPAPSPFTIGPFVPEPAVVTATALPAPPAPSPQVELPSSDADYLQNPRPAYPAVSKRLGEQGKVVLRVLIAPDGTAQQAEVRESSGFARLDQAALATVLKWRYVPGKRGGVAEAMWFNIPINFVLE